MDCPLASANGGGAIVIERPEVLHLGLRLSRKTAVKVTVSPKRTVSLGDCRTFRSAGSGVSPC